MALIRVGDKLIDRNRIDRAIDRILDERRRGRSQQEVAEKFKIDRSFISRLENLGEIRKGGTIAVVGFPIGNKEELYRVCQEEGVDFTLLLTEKERWAFVEERSGIELVNEIMELIRRVRAYDTVIVLGSDKRVEMIQALLGNDVVSEPIGHSPLREDVYYEPEKLRALIRALQGR